MKVIWYNCKTLSNYRNGLHLNSFCLLTLEDLQKEAHLNRTALWCLEIYLDVILYCLVNSSWSFVAACCLHHQQVVKEEGWAPVKCYLLFTSQHNAIYQTTWVFISAVFPHASSLCLFVGCCCFNLVSWMVHIGPLLGTPLQGSSGCGPLLANLEKCLI